MVLAYWNRHEPKTRKMLYDLLLDISSYDKTALGGMKWKLYQSCFFTYFFI
jgi:hypothetical protein